MRYATKIFVGHQRQIEKEINEWLGLTHPMYIVSTHTSSSIYQDPDGGYTNVITVVMVTRDSLI